MINENLYKRFEEETISKVNRFEISKKDLNELKKSFKNKITKPILQMLFLVSIPKVLLPLNSLHKELLPQQASYTENLV